VLAAALFAYLSYVSGAQGLLALRLEKIYQPLDCPLGVVLCGVSFAGGHRLAVGADKPPIKVTRLCALKNLEMWGLGNVVLIHMAISFLGFPEL
jgi:hypothetical protein